MMPQNKDPLREFTKIDRSVIKTALNDEHGIAITEKSVFRFN